MEQLKDVTLQVKGVIKAGTLKEMAPEELIKTSKVRPQKATEEMEYHQLSRKGSKKRSGVTNQNTGRGRVKVG